MNDISYLLKLIRLVEAVELDHSSRIRSNCPECKLEDFTAQLKQKIRTYQTPHLTQNNKFILCLHMIDQLEGLELDHAIEGLKSLLEQRKRKEQNV